MDCTCKVFDEFKRSPLTYKRGAHHEPNCMNYEPPTDAGFSKVCDGTPGEGSCWNCSSTFNCDRV